MLALLGLLPELVPVAAGLIARLFPGSTAEKVGETVAGVVASVAGSTDEAAVRLAMADPAKAGAVLAQLNDIAAQIGRAHV